MTASKKKRASSRAQTSKARKRSRVSKARASKALKDKALPFPAAILALPHVLELIDTFRMTPVEAAHRAVATGQSEWLDQLISSYGRNVTSQDMLVDAAAKGNNDVVKRLIPALLNWGHESVKDFWEIVLPAVVAASANGCYSTLQILLPKLDTRSLTSNVEKQVCKEVDKVLNEAAERGRLDAVAAIVENVEMNKYAKTIGKSSKALPRAAAGGHTDVIEFLLKLDRNLWKWDVPHAVAAAVEKKQTAIAMKLYGENPRYEGKSFFVCLARDGHTGAVEFFFPKVSSNAAVLNEALLAAATSDRLSVVEFLLATKRIPSDRTKRAFVVAAGHAASSVAQYLIDNHQISSETIGEGFVCATDGGHLSLVRSLYEGQQISGEVVLEAFKTTWVWTNLQKYLIEVLSDETGVPREFRHKAFVDAALTGKIRALKLLAMRELPLDVLKDAYATTYEPSKVIVRTIACEQLFNPNYTGCYA